MVCFVGGVIVSFYAFRRIYIFSISGWEVLSFRGNMLLYFLLDAVDWGLLC